jgi:hypothetical protein
VINAKSEKAKVLRGANTVGSLKLEIIYFQLQHCSNYLVWVRFSLRWFERPTSMQHFEDMMGIGVSNTRDSWLDPAPCV